MSESRQNKREQRNTKAKVETRQETRQRNILDPPIIVRRKFLRTMMGEGRGSCVVLSDYDGGGSTKQDRTRQGKKTTTGRRASIAKDETAKTLTPPSSPTPWNLENDQH